MLAHITPSDKQLALASPAKDSIISAEDVLLHQLTSFDFISENSDNFRFELVSKTSDRVTLTWHHLPGQKKGQVWTVYYNPNIAHGKEQFLEIGDDCPMKKSATGAMKFPHAEMKFHSDGSLFSIKGSVVLLFTGFIHYYYGFYTIIIYIDRS
jgi:hypothetical protein